MPGRALLRVRLLAQALSKRLLVASLSRDGDLGVESDRSLFERGLRKYSRHAAHIADGSGTIKDELEVATLRPLLDDFKKAFGVTEAAVKLGSRTSKAPTPGRDPVAQIATKAFSAISKTGPRDALLTFSSLPSEGDFVSWECATQSGTFQLGHSSARAVRARLTRVDVGRLEHPDGERPSRRRPGGARCATGDERNTRR